MCIKYVYYTWVVRTVYSVELGLDRNSGSGRTDTGAIWAGNRQLFAIVY